MCIRDSWGAVLGCAEVPALVEAAGALLLVEAAGALLVAVEPPQAPSASVAATPIVSARNQLVSDLTILILQGVAGSSRRISIVHAETLPTHRRNAGGSRPTRCLGRRLRACSRKFAFGSRCLCHQS